MLANTDGLLLASVAGCVRHRNDGLKAPLRPPGAEAVTVIGPVCDQAGQGRVGPVFHPGLGAVVALAAPAAAQCGLRLFVPGRARRAHVRAPDRAVPPRGGQIRFGLQVGQQARPDALVAPGRLTAIDRVPLYTNTP